MPVIVVIRRTLLTMVRLGRSGIVNTASIALMAQGSHLIISLSAHHLLLFLIATVRCPNRLIFQAVLLSGILFASVH